MSRLALLSDVHSNMDALPVVMDDIYERMGRGEVSGIYVLGDYVGYGAEPNGVISMLLQYPGILGNHDNFQIEGIKQLVSAGVAETTEWTSTQLTQKSKKFIRKLHSVGSRMDIDIGGKKVVLVHGSLADSTNEYVMIGNYYSTTKNWELEVDFDKYASDADAFFCAHTHDPGERSLTAGRFVVNIGSVGQPRDRDPRACYYLTDGTLKGTERIRLEYDVASAQRKILDAGLPEHHANRLATGT